MATVSLMIIFSGKQTHAISYTTVKICTQINSFHLFHHICLKLRCTRVFWVHVLALQHDTHWRHNDVYSVYVLYMNIPVHVTAASRRQGCWIVCLLLNCDLVPSQVEFSKFCSVPSHTRFLSWNGTTDWLTGTRDPTVKKNGKFVVPVKGEKMSLITSTINHSNCSYQEQHAEIGISHPVSQSCQIPAACRPRLPLGNPSLHHHRLSPMCYSHTLPPGQCCLSAGMSA